MSCNQNHIDILPVSKCLQLNLSIPEYQRPYKWSVQSIDDMLWDINNSVQQSLSYSNYKYRIGTIILHKSGDLLNVVDGQQRLILLLSFPNIWIMISTMPFYEIRSLTR